MGAFKSRNPKPKINKPAEAQNQGCSSEQHPWFSFRYMTENGRYSLKFLEKVSARDKAETLSSLCHRFEELSAEPWTHWMEQQKRIGLETMDFSRIKFSAKPSTPISKDTTVYVFRFDTYVGKGKGRIIGFKNSPCSVFHVIGYDFDLSAYDHGK